LTGCKFIKIKLTITKGRILITKKPDALKYTCKSIHIKTSTPSTMLPPCTLYNITYYETSSRAAA
jgi:hypothetical protein